MFQKTRNKPDEVLAKLAMRRWSVDRIAMLNPRTPILQRHGWQARRESQFDARHVRVMDFEEVLSQLPEDDQKMLILRHHNGLSTEEIAVMLHCSARKVSYALPAALARLARGLDRKALL